MPMRPARLLRVSRVAVAAAAAAILGIPAAAPAASATGAAVGAIPSPVCRPRTAPAAPGLTETGRQQIDPRLALYTFASRALGTTVHANVLPPTGYDEPANRSRRYPVMLLLHGAGGNASDWVRNGVEQIVGDTPLIVVMPDGGAGGWYTDWYGSDLASRVTTPPGWETFHLRELLPWVDATFRTAGDRQHRVIAGLSMGGFGAMSYAARHPDLFAAAGSFSGGVDTDLFWPLGSLVLSSYTAFSACIWGDPITQQVNVEAHDPTMLAGNLRGVDLFVATGNGQLGPYDKGPDPFGQLVELGAWEMNMQFLAALNHSGVPVTTWLYGAGTHTWPYWRADLARFLPYAMAATANPSPTPAADPPMPFDYRSAEPAFGVWGWAFTARHDPQAFTDLHAVTPDGFTATGTGSLDVVTPPIYQPGRLYTITTSGVPGAGSHPSVAGRDGRLHFSMGLGSGSPLGQLLAQPLQLDKLLAHTVHVRIDPAGA